MPDTKSPREKVAQIIKEKVSGPHFTDPSLLVAMEQDRFAAADAILAALASSGDHADHSGGVTDMADHAELARWVDDYERDAALDAEDDGDLSHVDDGLREFPMRRVKALLAEIAALRDREKAALKECSEWARKAGEAIGKLETSEAAGIVEGWQDRATEAERKLAEAVDEGLKFSEFIIQMNAPDQGDAMTEAERQMFAVASNYRTFLSKEAERG